ncbi:hypothetical protein CFAEC_05830 [Corynebacterium faecale]|uniref:DUF2550 domain-containing protein n=1 Tax=Corynebacterium faecale TaxID=1758466 RepID=UPI0025B390B0|nr:DUF2550 domain-containing protein [Corynebacterium faecale]WJY92002.1 hypothetical protein CFAEC_05830 [Corynebacterium faecale]
MEYIIWALVIIAVLAVMLAAWRFFTLRSRGTTVILRELPQSGVHGWRHGSLRYNGNDLEYFKVRSLSPMANIIFNRLSVELLDRREPTTEEAVFMSDGTRIVRIRSKEKEIEIGLDSHGEMAMTAWLEAARDVRAEHTLTPADFLRKQNRNGTQRDR